MNTLQKIYKAFNPSNDDLFLPNVYTPPEGLSTVKSVKTVQYGKRESYTNTFNNINKQLTR